ncbi:MAG TPA: hypothetical protein VGB53_10935 [Rubricoccaceae bacterium]|jgi:hypothetical protein
MPDDSALPTPPRPARGPNNRRQIETVTRNRQIVQNVLKDPEALALAAARGQDEAALTAGLPLADAYLTEYGERDAATGAQSGARGGLKATDRAAREAYNDLRSTLRTRYPGAPEREALGVARESAAGDRDAFLGEARSTLAAVRQDPYATAVAKVGYPDKALDAVAAAIDALEQAASGTTSATGTHGGSTDERDAAYRAFMDWMTPTRKWLTLAFKSKPAIARSVGLTARG